MENKENTFSYNYSAAEQAEVEAIRKKYLPAQPDKMEQLRALHNSAGRKAQGWAITLGIVGALMLGTGMSLFMSDLGTQLGLQEPVAMLSGIALGLAGLILVALAYPAYNRILKKERQRIAPEILRLTDELMK